MVSTAVRAFAGVDPHPDPQADVARPSLSPQLALGGGSSLNGRCRSLKGSGKSISAGREHVAAVSVDCPAHDVVVAGQGRPHSVRSSLPKLGRTLDVGEEEGDCSGGAAAMIKALHGPPRPALALLSGFRPLPFPGLRCCARLWLVAGFPSRSEPSAVSRGDSQG
jgi:hypothetical protein